MKGIVIGIIIVLLVLAGGWFLIGNSNGTGNSISGNTVAGTGDVKMFNVDSSHLRFYINGVENPDIVVNQGDNVIINFTSSEGFHDWKVDEFNAATQKVSAGETSSVQFVADKKGTFEYYCSVGQHRANGMKGKLIVN